MIEVGERISEPISQISGAPILLLENRVFNNGRPSGAMLLITSFKGGILRLGEGSSTFAARLLEEGRSVR